MKCMYSMHCVPYIVFYALSPLLLMHCYIHLVLCIFFYAFCSWHIVPIILINAQRSMQPSTKYFILCLCILFCASSYIDLDLDHGYCCPYFVFESPCLYLVFCISFSSFNSLYFIVFIFFFDFTTIYFNIQIQARIKNLFIEHINWVYTLF